MGNEPRDQLAALLEAHRVILHSDGVSWICQQCPDRRYHSYFPHDASREHQAEVLLALGWRPPPRRIETPEELDALPGRTIVVGNRGKFGTAWQLTSHEVLPNPGANWGSPFLLTGRFTSRQLLEHEGSVTVLWKGDPMSWHVGRSFSGHPLEDECPCPKEPCGLVILANAHPDCDQHPNKTMRQGHPADQCPGDKQ